MYPEKPTEFLALKVWWAMMWRTIPLSLIAGGVAGALIGLIVGITGGSPESVRFPAGLAGALIGLFVAVKVIKRLMTKGFGKYRLAVIKK